VATDFYSLFPSHHPRRFRLGLHRRRARLRAHQSKAHTQDSICRQNAKGYRANRRTNQHRQIQQIRHHSAFIHLTRAQHRDAFRSLAAQNPPGRPKPSRPRSRHLRLSQKSRSIGSLSINQQNTPKGCGQVTGGCTVLSRPSPADSPAHPSASAANRAGIDARSPPQSCAASPISAIISVLHFKENLPCQNP
jgi:hypothetical protein